VRGHKEEGTTSTPYDPVVRNDLGRYHLIMDAATRAGARGRSGNAHAADDRQGAVRCGVHRPA